MLLRYTKYFNPTTRNRSITIRYYNYLNYRLSKLCFFVQRGAGRNNSGKITIRGRQGTRRSLVPKVFFHNLEPGKFILKCFIYNDLTKKLYVNVQTWDKKCFNLPVTKTVNIIESPVDEQELIDYYFRRLTKEGTWFFLKTLNYCKNYSYLKNSVLVELGNFVAEHLQPQLGGGQFFNIISFLNDSNIYQPLSLNILFTGIKGPLPFGNTSLIDFTAMYLQELNAVLQNIPIKPTRSADLMLTAKQMSIVLENLSKVNEFTILRTEIPVYLKVVPYFVKFCNILIHQIKGITYTRSPGTFSIKLKPIKTQKLLKCVLPSTKVVFLKKTTLVIIGTNFDENSKFFKPGKAGTMRLLGFRPTTRGVAKNPVDHPNGGRTKSCQPEKTPWGWVAKRNK